ncbi:MAG: hypothetical protein EA412_06105 [Chitinophagaceae bacterium]|nr:MAG: hypothetical protein EA412_06105 [Chitinophagaceae bacterium]
MLYYIFKFIFKVIGLIPMRILYVFSDLLYLLLYRVMSYRKKIVRSNLVHAFPEKSIAEIKKIERGFYHNFCDMIFETLKAVGSDFSAIKNRFVTDLEAYMEVQKTGKSAFMGSSHFFNWEWGNWVLANQTKFQVLGIYMPIKSDWLERLMLEMRQRYGTRMIPVGSVREVASQYADVQTLEVYVTDQNPSGPDKGYWIDFMNRPVPFHAGLERVARKLNYPVIFERAVKVKRGHYTTHSVIAFENPADTEEGEITRAIVKFTEESIRQQPENYVWTHNRWKYTKHFKKYGFK